MSEPGAADLFSNRELAQTRLLIALEAAQLGTWDRDLSTGTLTMDARSAAMYGLTQLFFHGDGDGDVYRAIHPEDRTRVRQTVAAAIASQSDVDVEFRVLRPDASTRWIYTRGQVLPDATGRAARVTGTNADVTAARELTHQQIADAQALAGLVSIARELGTAATEEDVLHTVTERGTSVLGADGTGLGLPTADGKQVRIILSEDYDPQMAVVMQLVPASFQIPLVHTAVSGQAVFSPDAADASERFPDTTGPYASTGTQASAAVPLLSAEGTTMGSLSVGFTTRHEWRAPERELLEAFAALTAQALQRLAARAEEQAATAQQAALVAAAAALGQAESEEDVFTVVADKGLGLLGAHGSALCLREAGGTGVRTLGTDTLAPDVRAELEHLRADFPLPIVHSAITGTAHFHRDRDHTTAAFPGAEPTYVALDLQASVSVPLYARSHLLGSLSMGFTHPRLWPDNERELVGAFAALTAQALERIASREAEHTASAEVARFSETLQRSLLTAPPEPDHLQIAVRYAPAAADAQVGGDWYDAFLTSGGSTSLVIGDVTGHDSRAAAAMGQLRNVLRGIGYAVGEPPARVLGVLDHAAHDLAVGAIASVLVAQVEQTPDQHEAGTRLLRWSNAGHLPPLLITPDGATCYLDTEPDLLIGIDPDASRTDHEVLLAPGATVLLFTDGLIERRDAPLQQGLDWLAATATDLAHLPLEDLCDALLSAVGDRVEDDVALLALRAHPENAPRPPEAGPGRDPLQAPTVPSDHSGHAA